MEYITCTLAREGCQAALSITRRRLKSVPAPEATRGLHCGLGFGFAAPFPGALGSFFIDNAATGKVELRETAALHDGFQPSFGDGFANDRNLLTAADISRSLRPFPRATRP